MALDSELFSDFDLNISKPKKEKKQHPLLSFTFLYFSCACNMQTLFAKDLLHELKVKKVNSFIIHAATLSACSAAQQWLQCLQAGWHPSGIFPTFSWNILNVSCLGSVWQGRASHTVSHNMQVLEDMRHALGSLAEGNSSANSKQRFCPVCLVILTL